MLFHVSEDASLRLFEPRPSPFTPDSVVWAIDDERLRNYLLPRECPRVTFYAGPAGSDDDIRRFLGESQAVVAIERAWLDRVRACTIHCYHLPDDTFTCLDACAGYFVSRVAVAPAAMESITDPTIELTKRRVELRILNDLWPLHDAVAASTLSFSMIRMRNARRA